MQAQKAATAGVTVQGKWQAEFKLWELPEPDAKPEGIFRSKRDGMTWVSTVHATTIERFDPKKETFTTFHLRPGSEPNALVEHSGSGIQSTMYFTSREGGYVGEFDPNTREVREFKVGDTKVRLNDLTFDRNGVVWFTVDQAQPPRFPEGAMIGSLNLFSSEVRLERTSWAGAKPADLAVDSRGTILFSSAGTAKIGRVDPEVMHVRMSSLPRTGAQISGLTLLPDDRLWVTDAGRGYLGTFEPTTGTYEEWASPSGSRSRPGPVASDGKLIWYVETGTDPLMLVCFDPKDQTFQSWPLKGTSAVGRLFADENSVWLTLPNNNRIERVTLVR